MQTETPIQFLMDGPDKSALTIALSHGAGAPMDSPFMNVIANGLGKLGWQVVRFEFPYMAERRSTGKKKPPNRQPILLESWRAVIEQLGPERTIIGGKSMGGRMASLIADEAQVPGLVCLGYPFHPPGKPDRLRTEHLASLKTPSLFLQGERDPLGGREEVGTYDLSGQIRVSWSPDGDHGLKPRKRSGHTEEENLSQAIQDIHKFAGTLT
jgi:predicted alpha/beta-hydrolase family hydrolase